MIMEQVVMEQNGEFLKRLDVTKLTTSLQTSFETFSDWLEDNPG